jgi:2-dehydro-3-deoxyphosphogluconate aldolase / (4S)-4-hydroxy-2-oxoglutarate aldolase
MKRAFNQESFDKMPVVGILRNYSLEEIQFIAPPFQKAGLTTLEVTMNSPDAIDAIRYLNEAFPQLNLGAGTVCTQSDLEQAEAAGASFIVSPILDIELIHAAKEKGLAVFPGAFSPTEIYNAWLAGATAVKIFPATVFGPGYIKDIKSPLSEIMLLPTGGISKENIREYFEAGASGVGMGSSLFNKTHLKNRNADGLYEGFMEIVRSVSHRDC